MQAREMSRYVEAWTATTRNRVLRGLRAFGKGSRRSISIGVMVLMLGGSLVGWVCLGSGLVRPDSPPTTRGGGSSAAAAAAGAGGTRGQEARPITWLGELPDAPKKPAPKPDPLLEFQAEVGVGDPSMYYKTMPPKGNRQQTPLNADQEAIVEMMQYAWQAYRKDAWGKDTLRPVSHSSTTWFNTGLTILDSIDTLWIMNMEEEYAEARQWAATRLDLAQERFVNVFECSIRCLGGLLSAYALTGDRLWVQKARELGTRLMPAFARNELGLPTTDVNLQSGATREFSTSTSEATTLQLEFRFLAHLTTRPEFAAAVDRVMDTVERNVPEDELVSLYIDPHTGHFVGGVRGLGARADSFYEYLLKAWLLTGKVEDRWRHWFVDAADAVNRLLVRTNKAGITYLGELHHDKFVGKMDHLACFYPGVLALGAFHGARGSPPREADTGSYMSLAQKLTDTCYQMYNMTTLKLGPEIAHFDDERMYIKPNDAHSLLRPEAVEAFFILYRTTKDERYRQYGRQVYRAINQHARLADGGGFASVQSSLADRPTHMDHMESFFLAETLKYLFLLFSDDPELLPLDQWVFNTEAHPLPVFPLRTKSASPAPSSGA